MNLLGELVQEIATLNKCDKSQVIVGHQQISDIKSRIGFYITENPTSGTLVSVDFDLVKEYLMGRWAGIKRNYSLEKKEIM